LKDPSSIGVKIPEPEIRQIRGREEPMEVYRLA
jgi:hypothetical protein